MTKSLQKNKSSAAAAEVVEVLHNSNDEKIGWVWVSFRGKLGERSARDGHECLTTSCCQRNSKPECFCHIFCKTWKILINFGNVI